MPKPNPAAFKTRQGVPENGESTAAATTEPRPLYERLHCAGCHNPPDAKVIDPAKLSQKGVGTKFPKGRLAEFLLAPEAGFVWTRMPNFHLSEKEALELEDYLLATADKPKDVAAPTAPDVLEKGRQLVRTSGCLNCHALKLENSFQAPPLNALHTRHLKDRSKTPEGDCLGGKPYADFKLTPEARAGLDRFTVTGFDSLQRHVPSEFAMRQARVLNCNACHGQIDLVPPLEILGGKLKPEWSAKFLAGEIPHKIRYDNHPKGEVWVEARMPAFRPQAKELAFGLAALHGVPPLTPGEPPVDASLAEAGRKLVGKDGGFSCVACHAVGPMLAMEVFESEGVNLALSADRLLPSFYRRWFRNPLSIDPQTKMPMYFDEDGNSPLSDVLGGNGDAQITAVWHYLQTRDKIVPPKTGLE
jgi:mono/diheme cytochrome c family protein